LQSSGIGEPVKDLSVRLVLPERERVDHHEGEIARGQDAGIDRGDRDAWRYGHLFHGKVLTWRDGANTGEGDGHEGGGVEGRQKVGDEAGILEIGFDINGAQSSTTDDGLSIGEEAEERESRCGCEKKHGVGSVQMLSMGRHTSFITASVTRYHVECARLRLHPLRNRLRTPLNKLYPGIRRVEWKGARWRHRLCETRGSAEDVRRLSSALKPGFGGSDEAPTCRHVYCTVL
jgi:hypothetical protein